MSSAQKHTAWVKELAREAGFLDCGIATLRRLDEEENHLKEWLERGYHGKMQYMENHFEKRLDPRLIFPGATHLVLFLYNYYPSEEQAADVPKIARYAWGEDYHRVIKDKLHELAAQLQAKTEDFDYRVFTDSAPIMERQWAQLAGLGWIGKNSLLLHKQRGSYFFIGSLLCNLEFEADQQVTDHCGTCTACIDACPTQAIVADKLINATQCISYLTIEQHAALDDEQANMIGDRIFGCDICQEVCPWNRFSTPHSEPRFAAGDWLLWTKEKWAQLAEPQFHDTFGKSPIARAGYEKMMNNIKNSK